MQKFYCYTSFILFAIGWIAFITILAQLAQNIDHNKLIIVKILITICFTLSIVFKFAEVEQRK